MPQLPHTLPLDLAGQGLDSPSLSNLDSAKAFRPFEFRSSLNRMILSRDGHKAARPSIIAWIRSLNSANLSKAANMQIGPSELRRVKAGLLEDLTLAPFLHLGLSAEQKGLIFKDLCEELGHACAPLDTYKCKLSAIQAASMAASQIDADSGLWIQSAIDQGLDGSLLQWRRSTEDQAPSCDAMLPPPDCQIHPQFRLAMLSLKFGWHPHLGLQQIFDQAINLNLEKWRRFRSLRTEETIPKQDKESQWREGFEMVCMEAMPEGSRLDPLRHANLLELWAKGNLTEMRETVIAKRWFPLESWAKDPPSWLRPCLAAISLGETSSSSNIPTHGSDLLHDLALEVLVAAERADLADSIPKKNKAEPAQRL